MPKTVVGKLTEENSARVGFQTEVVLPATYDTGAAVMAVPTESDEGNLFEFRHVVADGH